MPELDKDNDVEAQLSVVKIKREKLVHKRELGLRIKRYIMASTTTAPATRSTLFAFVRSVAAACVIIALGISAYNWSEVKLDSGSKPMTFALPDKSNVVLSPTSVLEYNKIKWFFDRSLSLKGKAKFYVSHGENFVGDKHNGKTSV